MRKILIRHPIWIIFALIMPLSIMQPLLAAAQDASTEVKTTPATAVLSLDEIKAKRSEVENSQNLDKTQKDSALSFLDQAIGFRESIDEFNRQSEILTQRLNAAPQRIKFIQAELSKPLPAQKDVEEMAANQTGLQLEQRIQREQAQLAVARDTLAGWKGEFDNLGDSPGQLAQKITAAKDRLNSLDDEMISRTDGDLSGPVAESRRIMQRMEQLMLNAEIKSYEYQINSHELLTALIRAEMELASREITNREKNLNLLQARAADKVQAEAASERQKAEKARDEIPDSASAVKEQYDINIALSAELEDLAQQLTDTAKKHEQVTGLLKEIEADYALANERIKSLVITEAIGLALRRQRQLLPGRDSFLQSSADRRIRMSQIRETQYRLEDQRRELGEIDSETDAIIDSLVYLTPDRAEKLRPEVRDLLKDRRQLMEKLQSGYHQYFKNLQLIEFAEQQLVALADEYADFLDTHLVWIKSSSTLGPVDLKNSLAVLRALAEPANWRLAMSDASGSFKANTGWWILGILIIAGFISGRRWARREISRTAQKVRQPGKDSLYLSLWVLALTVYLAGGFPVMMVVLPLLLMEWPGTGEFSRAIASGLMMAAAMLVALRFFYHLCRKDGLAQVHFKWSEAIRQSLRRNLWWATPAIVITGFLVPSMANVKEIAIGESMAKLALILQMVFTSGFLGRILHFSGGIVSTLKKNYPTGWLTRLRYIWWPAAVGLPLLLAGLAAGGYFLSALQMRDLIRYTAIMVLGLIVLNSFALRWLTLARRRFALREARRKREAQLESERLKTADGESPSAADHAIGIVEEPEIGLAEISQQTHDLLRYAMLVLLAVGLWAIWEPVFPAFGILNEVQLWSYSSVVDGVTTSIPISLANLTLAVVVVVITVIASKNLPGLLGITILNRLPMDAGARHAFTTLCRYAITAIGIIVAFNTIGFRWSSVQWLVAALGVGLGFGLQEIVANFISGIIVLFERPFRVGDTVTVGDVSGTVSRIRIRATTIVDWDRKELIVPNKEFITGRLINWSLTDPISRFIVRVGIAYGSDVELAEKLLYKALAENPLVLNEPKPTAYFLGFGDNSLNFELRLYVNNIDNRLPVQHELHKAIDREFRKAGIVIAFPQRDVHFDSDRPLKVQMVPEGPETDSEKSEPEPNAT